jgi:cell division protein FtsQ
MAQKIPANTTRTIQRLAILGSILFVIGLLMTVRDWKLGSALAKETHINIKPVDGNTYIVAEDVKKIIRDSTGQDIENIVLGNLNIRSIEEKLKSNPFVLDAEVYVDARNHIYIEIEQNEPILRVIASTGNYYISKSGAKIPLSSRDVARVPVATGKIPKYRADYWKSSVNDLTTLYKVANFIHQDDFLRPLIEQIDMANYGNLILVPKLGHHSIEFGNDERLEEKFRYLKIFYKEALPQHGWEKYKTISLKYRGQVVGVK